MLNYKKISMLDAYDDYRFILGSKRGGVEHVSQLWKNRQGDTCSSSRITPYWRATFPQVSLKISGKISFIDKSSSKSLRRSKAARAYMWPMQVLINLPNSQHV